MSDINNWKLVDIVALSYFRKISSNLFRKIVSNIDSIEMLAECRTIPEIGIYQDQNILFDGNLKNDIIKAKESANKEIAQCLKSGYKIISFWDEEYPKLLKEIDYAPLILYVCGELQKSDSISISIVGTRRNSSYGKFIAEKFGECFAHHNMIVTSGLAYGIDTISHESVLKAGGITYAVIASGLDKISPELSKIVAENIVDKGGAIISEYKCNVPATPAYFPQRNRIISGISKATLVIESGEKGGALITAKFAFNQQREVYAVPGNINAEKSKGTNKLIKDNIASIALTPEDILSDLGLLDLNLYQNNTKVTTMNLSPIEEKIMKVIENEPVQIDKITELAGIDIKEALVVLLEMEFKNIIKQLPGKHYIKANL